MEGTGQPGSGSPVTKTERKTQITLHKQVTTFNKKGEEGQNKIYKKQTKKTHSGFLLLTASLAGP